jgi:hypothetical protein
MKDEALRMALEALESIHPKEYWNKAITAIKQAQAAQPAVPDAFGTREGEHPQYIQGWNDCRAEMLRGKS